MIVKKTLKLILTTILLSNCGQDVKEHSSKNLSKHHLQLNNQTDLTKAHNATGRYNYAEAFQLTPLFFAANQMGSLTDRRLSWRFDSATDGYYSGGYADAGDNIVFGKAQFAAIANMCITAHFFKDELSAMGQYDEMQRQIQHGIDFIVKAHVTDSEVNTQRLIVQLGDSPTDHTRWVSIEESTHARPIYYIDSEIRGSDYAALASAALGFCAQVPMKQNPQELTARSYSLFEFAKKNRGLGHENGFINTVYKNVNGDEDEIALAALGLYAVTGQSSLLWEAHNFLDDTWLGPWAGGYEHQEQMASLLLALADPIAFSARKTAIEHYFNTWLNVGSGLKQTEGGYIIHDENNWGSSGSVTPALMTMAIYSKVTGSQYLKSHITNQVNYLLGDNPPGLSYLCGFNSSNNCSKIHHRGASGGSFHQHGENNPYMLWGALLGGVTEHDWDFVNSHDNWTGNEPTISYNAQIQAPLLYMFSQFGGNPLSDDELQAKLDGFAGYPQ